MPSCFLKIPFLRIALSVVYLVLFILACVSLNAQLFTSPRIEISSISGTHLYGFEATLSQNTPFGQISGTVTNAPGMDIVMTGANASVEVGIYMWHVIIDFNVTLPYNIGFEAIHQKYNMEDIPCKEYTDLFKTMQYLALLTIFAGFIQLVLTVSNFFSRVLLPFVWVMAWVCVGMASGVGGLLMKRLTRASCYGTPEALPDFANFAWPVGGFGLYVIIMIGYLACAVMSAFL